MAKKWQYCHVKFFFWHINFNNPLYRLIAGNRRWCDWHKNFHNDSNTKLWLEPDI